VLLSCAVDALEVAFTMVDMSAADQPMVRGDIGEI